MWYVKKPIKVEAVKLPVQNEQLSEDKNMELLRFVQTHELAFRGFAIFDEGWSVITVDANRVNIPWGAYCVIDSKGYAYPCDAEIFEANHTVVEE